MDLHSYIDLSPALSCLPPFLSQKGTPWPTKIPVLLLEPRKSNYLNNLHHRVLYGIYSEERMEVQRAINTQSWRHNLILSSDSIFHSGCTHTHTRVEDYYRFS